MAISRKGLLAAAAGIWLGSAAPALAGAISVSWDSAAGASGYRVYWGTASRQYSSSLDVGNVTTATVTGLGNCTTWYLAVKAYNSVGESPDYSNEVFGWPRPEIASVTAGMQGSQYTMRILGTNFQTGVAVDVDEADSDTIALSDARTVSCSEIQVSAAIDPTTEGAQPAAVGFHRLTIENPDTAYAETLALEVLINPGRFDVNESDETTTDRLDGKDTAWISKLHSLRIGDSAYDPDGDLNGDGWIDGEDLSYIAANFGLCWSGNAWTLESCPSDLQ